MKRIACLLMMALAVLVLHQPSDAQIDPALAARLQFIIDSVRSVNGLSRGVSAAVLIPPSASHSGVWRGVSGTSHGAVPLTPGMKFCIASNTKLFIATLMLKLQEMNVLSLEDSLHRWIPTFPNVNPNITIRQLLNHTSGVYNYVEDSQYAFTMDADTARFWAPESMMTTFVHARYCDPGLCWHYSNTNYLLAGMIIKAATGTTVLNNLRPMTLVPLNLTSTFFPLEETVPDTIAHGWANNQEYSYPWTSWTSSQSCAGNIYSTPENLVRWYDSLFSGRVISQSSLNELLTFVPTGTVYDYGLGIARRLINGRTKYQHDGVLQKGYKSGIRIDATRKYIVAVLNNQYVADPFWFINALDSAVGAWWDTMTVGVSEGNGPIPHAFRLYQNYPNPFNPSTTIAYSIGTRESVSLRVYDLLGREVATLVNEVKQPGSYEVTLDASGMASGVYLYRLEAGTFRKTNKLVLMR